MTRLRVRLRALLSRRRTEAELDEELRYHLEREIERNLTRGMSARDARDAARRVFGNIGSIKDDVRDSWSIGWIEALGQDVRFAARSFRRAPAFAITVVATIALALGLNTTAFTVFNAYVLRPIAVREPYSLYSLRYFDRRGHPHSLTRQEFDELQRARSGAPTFAYHYTFARVDQQPMFGGLVTGHAFQILGVPTALGRALLPEDTLPNATPVLVLSDAAWRSRFGADTSIVGRQVRIRGVALTVVGVLAKRFQGLTSVPPDFWAPITLLDRLEDHATPASAQSELIRPVVRLAPAETEAQARAKLTMLVGRLTHERPDSLKAAALEMTSLAHALPRNDSETFTMFAPVAVAFGLVLLIACANVANMMLARALARQREIGIRLTLGAERARLVRQLLTESALLALPAAAVGFFISRWTLDAGVRVMFATMPRAFVPYIRVLPLTPDLRVFGFMLVAALTAALLFGLVPALQATKPNVVHASRSDFDTGFRTGRLRGALVVGQVTVCALLLVVTGILLRGAKRARRTETGMKTDNVIQIVPADRDRQSVIQRVREHRDVREVAGSLYSPLDAMLPAVDVRAGAEASSQRLAYNFVTENYFSILGVPMLQGRGFTKAEAREGAQVAVISDATARRLWPGQSPIGQRLHIVTDVPPGSNLGRVRVATVVGVAGNTVTGWIGTGLERSVAYFPIPIESSGVRLLARVTGNELQMRNELDRDLDTALPTSPLDEIHTLNDYLAVQRYPFQAFSWVAAAVGFVALLLTVTGIYGVLSYLVTQRTKEIGIRIALGAGLEDVIGMVLRQSLLFALLGTTIGTALALVVSRLFATVLIIVDTFDKLAYAGGAAVVIAAALAAAYAPARRAAAVDPLTTLKGV